MRVVKDKVSIQAGKHGKSFNQWKKITTIKIIRNSSAVNSLLFPMLTVFYLIYEAYQPIVVVYGNNDHKKVMVENSFV